MDLYTPSRDQVRPGRRDFRDERSSEADFERCRRTGGEDDEPRPRRTDRRRDRLPFVAASAAAAAAPAASAASAASALRAPSPTSLRCLCRVCVVCRPRAASVDAAAGRRPVAPHPSPARHRSPPPVARAAAGPAPSLGLED